ncbi:MAG TPA: hypothetical protein VE264_01820, partial [Nitrososphaera sp.]|nr:hypothetical protein [Nitrososphaera sp.]
MSKVNEDNTNFPNKALVDGFGRVARKLRLSVTDRCNMQCIYCMPSDMERNDKTGSNKDSVARKWGLAKDEILSYEEFLRISHIMAKLGIEKIRV